MSRNIILYGPPGTGKTYKAKHLAVKLLENGVNPDEDKITELLKETNDFTRDIVIERFQNKLNISIKMISFHQSFSYEDFVEGKTLGENGKVENQNGILKDFLFSRKVFISNILDDWKKSGKFKIVNKEDYWKYKVPAFVSEIEFSKDGTHKNISINKTSPSIVATDYDKFKIHVKIAGSAYASNFMPTQDFGQKNVSFVNNSPAHQKVFDVLTKLDLTTINNELRTNDFFDKIWENTEILLSGKNNSNAEEFYIENTLRKFYKPSDRNNTFSLASVEKAFLDIERLRYVIPDIETVIAKYINDLFKNKSNYNLPKVLIIDEINRGNISSIFGELITLLEDSYRFGKKEAISITLPSGEKFSLPNNLYIIGTMNTADRSAEQMDAAMRRRFEFVELIPDSNLIAEKISKKDKTINENDGEAIEEINLRKVFETINKRLTVLMGRDYCIGHSYFMKVTNVDSLKKLMFNEVIPLLEQYFYNDIEKIGFVLSKDFVDDTINPFPNGYSEFEPIKILRSEKDIDFVPAMRNIIDSK